MANKLKTEVHVNGEGADIDLVLTPEQAVVLLDYVMEGATVHINLQTPVKGAGKRDTPEVYAA